jgi:hypothetical protein
VGLAVRAVRVATLLLVPFTLGAGLITLRLAVRLRVPLVRLELVAASTKVATFLLPVAAPVARLTRRATRVPAAIQPREETEHRAQPWARLAVPVAAVEVGPAAVNLRLTGMALRRLTVETEAQQAPTVRLAVKAAYLPTVAAAPAVVVAVAAACLPLLVLKVGRAVPVAQDLMEC